VDGPSWNNFVDIAALGYMLLNSTSLSADRYAPPLENFPTCDRATASLRLHPGKSEDPST
jgi:hypothetical protein